MLSTVSCVPGIVCRFVCLLFPVTLAFTGVRQSHSSGSEPLGMPTPLSGMQMLPELRTGQSTRVSEGRSVPLQNSGHID